jgi:hypothetical protein
MRTSTNQPLFEFISAAVQLSQTGHFYIQQHLQQRMEIRQARQFSTTPQGKQV